MAVSKKSRKFAGVMREDSYVITAVNVLTGQREEISGPMPEDAARERLAREIESRKRQRYQPHKKLRVEKRLPVQLTLIFESYGKE